MYVIWLSSIWQIFLSNTHLQYPPRFGNIRSMHLVIPPPCKDLKECVGETQIEVWQGEEPKGGTNATSVMKQSQQDLTQAQICINNIHSPSSMPSICAHNIAKDCVDTIGLNIESIIPFSCKYFKCCIPRVLPNFKGNLHDISENLNIMLKCSFLIISSQNSNSYSVV